MLSVLRMSRVFRSLGSLFLAFPLASIVTGCANNGDAVSVAESAVTATPAFVQVSSAVPQTAQTTVAATFNNAQTAGNLIVAIVGWNDAVSNVTAIADSKGNVYQLAVHTQIRTLLVMPGQFLLYPAAPELAQERAP